MRKPVTRKQERDGILGEPVDLVETGRARRRDEDLNREANAKVKSHEALDESNNVGSDDEWRP